MDCGVGQVTRMRQCVGVVGFSDHDMPSHWMDGPIDLLLAAWWWQWILHPLRWIV